MEWKHQNQLRRYKKLKLLGRCTACGKEKSTETVLCDPCRRLVLDKRHAKYLELVASLPPKIKPQKAIVVKRERFRKSDKRQPKVRVIKEKKKNLCRGCAAPVSGKGVKYCGTCKTKKCGYCQNSFNPRTQIPQIIYCSKKCYTEAMKGLRGPQARNWQGGKIAEKACIRLRSDYRDWRTAVFERDDWTCQDCGRRNGNGKRIYLHAHHIKEFAKYPELRTELSNGLTLCRPCHHKRHRKVATSHGNGPSGKLSDSIGGI